MAIHIFLSTLLQNFFLCQDRQSSVVPPHLAQPCYVALGRALIWGLNPDWFEGSVNWVPITRLGPTVTVTAGPLWYHIITCLEWDLNLGPKSRLCLNLKHEDLDRSATMSHSYYLHSNFFDIAFISCVYGFRECHYKIA